LVSCRKAAIRFAGTIHRLEGREGEISEETPRFAVAIGFWLAHEYHEVVSRPLEPSATERNDAQTLADALSLLVYQHCGQFGTYTLVRSSNPDPRAGDILLVIPGVATPDLAFEHSILHPVVKQYYRQDYRRAH
jgi:hypothetical protein